MVSVVVTVSKKHELFIIEPRVKINGQYYWDNLNKC